MQQNTQQNRRTRRLDAIPETAVSVVVRDLPDLTIKQLKEHGCKFIPVSGKGEDVTILYPYETTRLKLIPLQPHRIQGTNYHVRFSNGFELREVQVPGVGHRALHFYK